METRFIGAADATIVVTQSIADWYASAYALPALAVVRNLPKRPVRPVVRHHLLHRELHIPPGDLIFLYLGLIDDGRGYREIIEAFEAGPKDRHAVFMGFGPSVGEVQAAHARSGNIHHKPAVPSGEVIPMAAGADVGLLTVEGSSLSYRYSLANKFFQCRGAGLPVISTDLVEHRRYLDQHGGGWIIPELTGPCLARQVAALSREEIEARRAEIIEPCPYWDSEEAIFLSVMDRILLRREAAA
jgi:glycosyltransferase involved in cell wall biosynthesis